jgi:hypothetical protein
MYTLIELASLLHQPILADVELLRMAHRRLSLTNPLV